MSTCSHPKLLVKSDRLSSNGKFKYYPISLDGISDLRYQLDISDSVLVPCGHCISCRLNYSRSWADRMMLEYNFSPSSYFVTLTYDEDHVPWNDDHSFRTLRKRDVELFFKKLRDVPNIVQLGSIWDSVDDIVKPGIRYFYAGEYGSKTFRPHYHIILFNVRLDDLSFWKTTKLGDKLYMSETLSKCWSNVIGNRGRSGRVYESLGNVIVAPVTWQTCAYVSRYTAKKNMTDFRVFENMHVAEPFVEMSRRPGIGAYYYLFNPDLFRFSNISLSTVDSGKKVQIPKYFYRLLERDDPCLAMTLRESNKDASIHRLKVLLDSLDMPFDDYLSSSEISLRSRVKALVRPDI